MICMKKCVIENAFSVFLSLIFNLIFFLFQVESLMASNVLSGLSVFKVIFFYLNTL